MEQTPQQILKDKITKIKEQANKELLDGFWAGVKEQLFDKLEGLESISWTQYTPYFNDGEVCYFRTNAEYPDINEGSDVELTDEQSELIDEKVTEFFSVFDNDDYESMFGDHVEVIITKDGISVTEYEDHD